MKGRRRSQTPFELFFSFFPFFFFFFFPSEELDEEELELLEDEREVLDEELERVTVGSVFIV